MSDLLNDPDHWRKNASEMRKLAEGTSSPSRESLLTIADEYDKLAERAAERVGAASSSGIGPGPAKPSR